MGVSGLEILQNFAMPSVKNVVKPNFYRDSLQLMQLSEDAKKLPGVKDAAVVMGTSTNKELLERLGLLAKEGREASESDILIAVQAEDAGRLDGIIKEVEEILTRPVAAKAEAFSNIDDAMSAMPEANLAVVSIPGEYARNVVKRFLDRGIHVHLFSDHVSHEDEAFLKKYASERGLFVLGPGAGTSIIGGKAIAFANVVRRGNVGIAAAAGTGLQEVSVLISRAGGGVSEGLGIGGGDVKSYVGGIMAVDAVKALEADPETKVVCLVSKPPSPDTLAKLMSFVESQTKKKFVICFLGTKKYEVSEAQKDRIFSTKSLHVASAQALRFADGEDAEAMISKISMSRDEVERLAAKIAAPLRLEQRYVRGLYTGGTLTFESMLLFTELFGGIHSNAPLDERLKLADSYKSEGHTLVDLGEEEFTSGRAHPMIDPTVRKLRLVDEARDGSVAVIIMDVVLGYGSNRDPAGAMISSIREAKAIARAKGRELPILAHVCGTDQDPQPLKEQEEKLVKEGVVVLPSNALMAVVAGLAASRGNVKEDVKRLILKEYLGV
jgi:FdrA protein